MKEDFECVTKSALSRLEALSRACIVFDVCAAYKEDEAETPLRHDIKIINDNMSYYSDAIRSFEDKDDLTDFTFRIENLRSQVTQAYGLICPKKEEDDKDEDDKDNAAREYLLKAIRKEIVNTNSLTSAEILKSSPRWAILNIQEPV